MLLLHEIDFNIGPMSHYRKPNKPVGWNRPNLPRGRYRAIAISILFQITGSPGSHYYGLWSSDGKLDPKLEWILDQILDLKKSDPKRKFLEAVAKDVGVWPEPKWRRVKRRLQGAAKTSTRHSR